ncbi:MAG TPA: flagellar regulator YcgR PilZN domain-containing protein [Xanthomonadaceae bacterium]|jgi:c-di-GMP-binding flagellar brake protein YcgR|nr:flagellar regulator YcgR PilZN domain-containing protein [Xanthomonadaceae bacterium]
MNEVASPSAAADLDAYYDKFYVHGPAEIRRHLQRLVDGRCAVAAHPEGSGASVVTVVLQVEDASLWVDLPPGEAQLRAWLAAPQLRFEGSIERVALRFSCGPATMDSQDGRPALLLPMPTRLLHLQRREYMRREPPPGALTCRLAAPPAGREVEATIRDIGGGGLAVVATREAIDFAVGEVLGSRIDLPGIGEVEVDLRVCHVVAREHRGRALAQAGCEFVELDPAAQRKLFRYLMQLDRAALARRRLDE